MVNNNDDMMGSRSISGGISKKAEMVVVKPNGYDITMDMSVEDFIRNYIGYFASDTVDAIRRFSDNFRDNGEPYESLTYSNYLWGMFDEACLIPRYYADEVEADNGMGYTMYEILTELEKIIGDALLSRLSDTMLTMLISTQALDMLNSEENNNEKAA